jgi:MATE family multidrug resistance protein
MTGNQEVRATARMYLPWVMIGPLYSVWCFLIDGIFIGATRAREMRNMAFLSALTFIASILIFVPWLGNHGLWFSYLIYMITRAVTLGSHYPSVERSISAPG